MNICCDIYKYKYFKCIKFCVYITKFIFLICKFNYFCLILIFKIQLTIQLQADKFFYKISYLLSIYKYIFLYKKTYNKYHLYSFIIRLLKFFGVT